MYQGPQKLDASYQIPSSYVHDHVGLIDNTEALNETLDNFREVTGICPYIIVVERTMPTQKEMEDYAYQFYLENFDDEEHFLIVITEEEYLWV